MLFFYDKKVANSYGLNFIINFSDQNIFSIIIDDQFIDGDMALSATRASNTNSE